MASKKPKNNQSEELVDQARHEAVRVLQNCSHRMGLKASSRTDGYPHIWARDSMITLLGGLFSGNRSVVATCRRSSDTLRRHQTDLGLIPNNVHSVTGRISYRAYADGGLWYVVGVRSYFGQTEDRKYLEKHWPTVLKTLDWYAYQDVDNSGLISMQEAGDWEDLFAVRGKGLYVNSLYVLALRHGAALAKEMGEPALARTWNARAKKAVQMINHRLWYTPQRATPLKTFVMVRGADEDARTKKYFKAVKDRIWLPKNDILPDERYYLPYSVINDFGRWFDTLGNMMAILAGVSDSGQADDILDLVEDHRLTANGPIKALYPSIQPGDYDWREYYRNLNLNLPEQYHNGGIWPFVGGFYIAALVKARRRDQAAEELVRLAELNHIGRDIEWEFNEWYHGKSGQPMGKVEQAWSAGMYLFAHECVERGKVPLL